MKKWKVLVLLCVLAALGMTACGGNGKDADGANTQQSANTQMESDTESHQNTETEVVSGNINPLTGEANLSDEAIGKRPVAVMINNLKVAMPQDGIGTADIIFELPVEGGLSRIMAVYSDYTKVPRICSVRSCRKYFADIADGFDAVYVCSGMNSNVMKHVKEIGVTLYVGDQATGGLFGRDQARKDAGASLEHTMYFDGTGLAAAMEKRQERTDLAEGKNQPVFNFAKDVKVPTGEACKSIKISYGSASSALTYDEASKKYLKEVSGIPQVDGLTGEQLAFENVLLLETTVADDSNGMNKTVDWHGGKGSTAYYVSNGMVQSIYWTKENTDAQLKFYDLEGNELEVNKGKTFISFTSSGKFTLE